MNTDVDNLKSFIEKIRSLNFFQRLFGWKNIRNALLEIEVNQLETDTVYKGIVIEDLSDGLNKVRLYKE